MIDENPKGGATLNDLRAQLPECPLEYQSPAHSRLTHSTRYPDPHRRHRLAGEDAPLDARQPH